MSEPLDPLDRRAPEGMVCARHPDRPALARCPLCGRGACIVCWHDPFDRCESCLRDEPGAAAPPVPWEDPHGGGAIRRVVDTMVTALRPTATAPSFARPEVAPAVRFALLTALPLALLRGVVPYTHTLMFGDAFGVVVRGSPGAAGIALDVARSMGISLLVVAVAWASLVLPYVSLAGAYGGPGARAAAMRVLLYRAWLVAIGGLTVTSPAGFGLLFSIAAWALPAPASQGAMIAVQLVDTVVPLMLLLFTMRAGARFGAGTGALASFVVTLVPFVLMLVLQGLLFDLIAPWMPQPGG